LSNVRQRKRRWWWSKARKNDIEEGGYYFLTQGIIGAGFAGCGSAKMERKSRGKRRTLSY